MRNKLVLSITILISFAMIISACSAGSPTQDPNAQITIIANTVQAQLTQMALLTPSATPTLAATATSTKVPATATPSGPTATITSTPYPTVGNTGDNSKFVTDVTIPDGTQFTPGTQFVKTWRFANTGSTTWTKDYKLVYIDGTVQGKDNNLSVNLPGNIAPGATLDISVTFVAPTTNGSYISYWKLYSASGLLFGEPCTVKFTVGTTASTPVTPTPTTTTIAPTATT